MDEPKFHIVDVFAEEPFAGNQLAVFENGHLYSDAEMQRLAREMNFSEITFIFPRESEDGCHKVRIFAPQGEMPFAGHPTLGTAFVIATSLSAVPPAEVALSLKAGRIPVRLDYGERGEVCRLTMQQLPPVFGPEVDPAAIAEALGLPADALDARYPVQQVSTGVPFLIVPLSTRSALETIKVEPQAVSRALAHVDAKAVLAFCPEPYEPQNQLSARVFVHHMGIPEDPATGSANGCLAGYLLHYEYFGAGPLDIRVEQGYGMGRKSLLYLTGERSGDQYRVQVGGKVQRVARGSLSPDAT
ncbi:MAG: PhzF family phenazine biosynthesis protein [Chloroflexota bacterium]|nr:PhzF family phenazine biosynthesis protein [Chloroflexota bacterium]